DRIGVMGIDMDIVDQHVAWYVRRAADRIRDAVVQDNEHRGRGDTGRYVPHPDAIVIVRHRARLPEGAIGMPARIVAGRGAAGTAGRRMKMVSCLSGQPLHDVELAVSWPTLPVEPEGRPVADVPARTR